MNTLLAVAAAMGSSWDQAVERCSRLAQHESAQQATLPVRYCRQAARTYADMQESVRRSCEAGGVAVFVDGQPVTAAIVGGRLIAHPPQAPDVARR